jgi:hypothetical protein
VKIPGIASRYLGEESTRVSKIFLKFLITKKLTIEKRMLDGSIPCFTNKKYYSMKVDILTADDLMVFKAQLINEIKELLSGSLSERDLKPFLKSKEVRKLLSISAGTLHTLRTTGIINAGRILTINERLLNNKTHDNRGFCIITSLHPPPIWKMHRIQYGIEEDFN